MELRKLTQADHDILHAMENVVDGIAKMYGQHTEVVLHSLDSQSPSVVKIANGHITSRSSGAPITNLAFLKLKEGRDVSDSYFSKTSEGKTLRSITTIVRNRTGEAIGLLCINSDMDVPMHAFIQTLLPTDQTVSFTDSASPETFAQNIDETIVSTIDTVKQEIWSNPTVSPSKRNREVVTRLSELGIFKYQDSKQTAAEVLEISRDTVYLYLRELEYK
ncbi:hypothetical protein HC723_11850 [Vibrio sp. S11_S32]|uniref:PAS domain-containing protein n=1 Tax=Vibrio sp. S11_S32 TaxID=2720225 RepID=UPI0016807328|nr:hypothetical protein [Vibrio sp. S11_S32]